MSSAIFTNGVNAYQVSRIIYAGTVAEIPESRRLNGNTHSFKITTGLGSVFCYYKDEESAKKSRGALAGMLDATKPKAFKHGFEFLDPSRVISFGSVFQFKKPQGVYTHGFVVTVETVNEKSQDVWFRYKSEDHAKKGRKALWATLHTLNGRTPAPAEKNTAAEPAVSTGLPF
jgi:hypothetical protein